MFVVDDATIADLEHRLHRLPPSVWTVTADRLDAVDLTPDVLVAAVMNARLTYAYDVRTAQHVVWHSLADRTHRMVSINGEFIASVARIAAVIAACPVSVIDGFNEAMWHEIAKLNQETDGIYATYLCQDRQEATLSV